MKYKTEEGTLYIEPVASDTSNILVKIGIVQHNELHSYKVELAYLFDTIFEIYRNSDKEKLNYGDERRLNTFSHGLRTAVEMIDNRIKNDNKLNAKGNQ